MSSFSAKIDEHNYNMLRRVRPAPETPEEHLFDILILHNCFSYKKYFPMLDKLFDSEKTPDVNCVKYEKQYDKYYNGLMYVEYPLKHAILAKQPIKCIKYLLKRGALIEYPPFKLPDGKIVKINAIEHAKFLADMYMFAYSENYSPESMRKAADFFGKL